MSTNTNKPVYIVLEHHTKRTDAIIHGVYTTRAIAEGKVNKLIGTIKAAGYLCILKKTPEGPTYRQLAMEACIKRLDDKWGPQFTPMSRLLK